MAMVVGIDVFVSLVFWPRFFFQVRKYEKIMIHFGVSCVFFLENGVRKNHYRFIYIYIHIYLYLLMIQLFRVTVNMPASHGCKLGSAVQCWIS